MRCLLSGYGFGTVLVRCLRFGYDLGTVFSVFRYGFFRTWVFSVFGYGLDRTWVRFFPYLDRTWVTDPSTDHPPLAVKPVLPLPSRSETRIRIKRAFRGLFDAGLDLPG